MSRAFVKENDLEHAGTDLPERPQSAHPNYVTPAGLRALQAQAAALELQRSERLPHKDDPVVRQQMAVIERDLRYFQGRLERAILVVPASQPRDTVLFGATVVLEDDDGNAHRYAIVGEDEADIGQGKVSWVSPLARALMNHKVGDHIVWKRPVGDLGMEITHIEYLEESA